MLRLTGTVTAAHWSSTSLSLNYGHTVLHTVFYDGVLIYDGVLSIEATVSLETTGHGNRVTLALQSARN